VSHPEESRILAPGDTSGYFLGLLFCDWIGNEQSLMRERSCGRFGSRLELGRSDRLARLMLMVSIYKNVWFRRVPVKWDGRTDVRPSVIENDSVTIALFVFPDQELVFVPMADIREAVAGLEPGANGSLIFTVDTQSMSISSRSKTIRSDMSITQGVDLRAYE
jgi:hypothetical protein